MARHLSVLMGASQVLTLPLMPLWCLHHKALRHLKFKEPHQEILEPGDLPAPWMSSQSTRLNSFVGLKQRSVLSVPESACPPHPCSLTQPKCVVHGGPAYL